MTKTGTQSTRRRRSRPKHRPTGSDPKPIPLHKRSSSHFQRGDRQRGAEYSLEGRVTVEIEGSRVRARVEGSERRSYGVGIDWSRVEAERVLHAFCECQRFSKGNPCKHVWATLLTLDEVGPTHQPPGRGRVGLRKDGAASWTDVAGPMPAGQSSSQSAPSAGGRARTPRRRSRGRLNRRPTADTWRSQLAALHEEVVRRTTGDDEDETDRSDPKDATFLVNTAASVGADGVVLDLYRQTGKGEEAHLERLNLEPRALEQYLRAEIAEGGEELALVAALPPASRGRGGRSRRGGQRGERLATQRVHLPLGVCASLLPALAAEGRLGWWDGRAIDASRPLAWDDGPPWHFALRIQLDLSGEAHLRAGLERNGDRLPLSAPVLILAADGEPEEPSYVVLPERIARLDLAAGRDLPWIELLRERDEIRIPRDDLEEALTLMLELPRLPHLEMPEEMRLEQEVAPLRPRVMLEPDPISALPDPPLLAELSFGYGDMQVSASDPRPAVIDWEGHRFLRRDMDAEHRALVRLLEAGLRPLASRQGHELELPHRELPAVAEPLLADGWEVEVRGTSLRPPSPPALRIESGIDWFELSGSMEFAGDRIELKTVLEAISRGDRFIELGDGSKGLLPTSLVEAYGSLADLSHGDSEQGLRFLPSQALLVDALLSAMPPTQVDASFADLREKLRSFESIKPKKEPRGFNGTLRGYQREGLGWLGFLREFGLGGVLADDMGLGKTVQVLALLRAHRTPSKTTGRPYLVVAPRSLVYNWIDEAARFAPSLEVVEYGGPDREALQGRLDDFDIVVTTYGTLRRDIAFLAKVEFDTVILDEAQAIKNRDSQAAKASRLLHARHRLALTGTPIENHLGELGSIFEFLNPGLLGRLPRLEVLVTGRAASKEELALVAEGIRPFILRRTKAQVLADLPPKTEQVLLCTLHPKQRELYDQVKAGYQATLLAQIEGEGVSGSSIQVLEALLRLRQIACHPGLVDPSWAEAGSTKLDAMIEQMSEVLEEGHKLIVFSQFTKLLAYVQAELESRKIEFAYLDGQTRKRGEVVERFQTDSECNVFLISLKAGGVGLNLTAAGYVYLLDPWWNPAVEAQAIDRAHRIGQTQPVFSYRLIARDTVEEKIVDLQRSKKQLASAILDGEGIGLRDLTSDDLRMLLA